jgi:hypothetical protein
MSDFQEARSGVIAVVSEATQPISPALVIKILVAQGLREDAVRSALWHCLADHEVVCGQDWRLTPAS